MMRSLCFRAASLAAAILSTATLASAQSIPTSLEDLLAAGRNADEQVAMDFRDEWIVPQYAARIDLEAGTVWWQLMDDRLLVADITLLMVAPTEGPVTWAWAIDTPPLPPSPALDAIRTHGATHMIDQLTNAQLDLSASQASQLALIALLFEGVEGVAHFPLSDDVDGVIVAIGPMSVE